MKMKVRRRLKNSNSCHQYDKIKAYQKCDLPTEYNYVV